MMHAKFQDHGTLGQGHTRVIIYTNFAEFDSLMMQAKFQDHGTLGQGHTKVIIYTKFVNLESLMVHV